jgi:hypothetical protein
MSQKPGLKGRKVKCLTCGAEVIVGTSRSGQRVKCPKCTSLMPVEDPEQPTASATEVSQMEALREQVARLEARILALEAQQRPPPVETHVIQPAVPAADEPAPLPPTPDEAGAAAVSGKLKWVHNDDQMVPSTTRPGIVMPDELHEQALVHNLRVLSGNEIIIRSAAGNDEARQLAERFKQLFTDAEWRVNGVADMQLAPKERGLSLAAGSLPPSREATRTFLAFTAAGFALGSRLDIALQSDETMLIVA